VTRLDDDYAEAGFAARLGAGDAPAVLVVDVLRAYLDADSPFHAGVEDARASAGRIVDAARGAGHPVVFTRVRYGAGGADAGLFLRKVPSLRIYADPADPRGDFPDHPRPADDEVVVTKQYASAFFGTSLASTLRRWRHRHPADRGVLDQRLRAGERDRRDLARVPPARGPRCGRRS
jgi:maleamate amidohydrolase